MSAPTKPPDATPRRSAARGALTLMGGTLASRVSGLLREVLIVALFPVRSSDAFRIAWIIPNLFRELLAEGALTNAFVPLAQRLEGADRRAFAGALLSILALLNALLLALALVAAPWIIDLVLAANSNVDRELAITLLRLTFPVLATMSFSALAMGVLQAEERFFAPAWAPVALNLAAIAAMLLFPGESEALALGVVAGGVLQALVQWPVMLRHRIAPRLGSLWHASMPLVLTLMLPFAFTTGARQLLNVVAQRMVSDDALFPAGAVTAYAIAAGLFSLVLGLFAISPATAYYARLGRLASEGSTAFAATLTAGTRFILLLTLPVGALMFVFADEAVRTLFEFLRPAAGQDSAIALAVLATAPLGLALPAAGLVNFLLRPFYVRKRVLPPVLLSLAFALVTAALYLTLAPRWGIAGLSYALAFASTAQATVLLLWLRRAEGLDLASVLRQWASVAAAGWLSATAAKALVGLWAASWTITGWTLGALTLAAGGTLALLLFALMALALRVPELRPGGWV